MIVRYVISGPERNKNQSIALKRKRIIHVLFILIKLPRQGIKHKETEQNKDDRDTHFHFILW